MVIWQRGKTGKWYSLSTYVIITNVVKCQSRFGSGDLRTILTSVLPDELMLPPPPPPGFPPSALFPPQAAILPQGVPVLAPPPFPTVVCFPYASLSPPIDPWHHRLHAPASCLADVGLHATTTFGIIERPIDSPNCDVDQRQQLLPLQAANN